MNIEIQGLNQRQRKIADLLWNCDSVERLRLTMHMLPPQDRRDAEGITEIMIQEFLWETLEDDHESKELCADLIARVSSN